MEIRALSLFVLVVVSIAVSAGAAATAGGDGAQSYIVQMSKQERPSVFTSGRAWYASTFSAVKGLDLSTSDDDSQVDGVVHYYENVLHGFSGRLTAAEVAILESKPGVLKVHRDTVKHTHTTYTSDFLGISPTILAEAGYGEDVIIGLLDTGVWPESKSFSDDGIGPIPSRWKGSCVQESSFNASSCNRKLIGAKYFVAGREAATGPVNTSLQFRSPRDNVGHGSHTASTAAGMLVPNVSMLGYSPGTARGVVPKARIAVYKVCWEDGCSDSDILAGFDAAVADGVDIISLSIGGYPIEHFEDIIAIAAYGAIKEGIFVTCSGGNEGPSARTVTNTSPWMTTVAASTVGRSFPSSVKLGNGASYTGKSMASGSADVSNNLFPIVWAANASIEGSTGANYCTNGTLDPAKVKGKIVLCDRGSMASRLVKGQVCKDAGAVGMILRNLPQMEDTTSSELHFLPATWVDKTTGQLILDYITNSSDPKASIVFGSTTLGDKPAPEIATFSSRGPNRIMPAILKPDIAAPGVNILAAWTPAVSLTETPEDDRTVSFKIISGTSMASPHITGVGALLKSVHPEWSPAAIRSAIMTTASPYDNLGNVIKDIWTGNETSPFSYGAGQVAPAKALDPGLVYDLVPSDYLEFLCASNYTDEQVRRIDPEFTSCSSTSGKIVTPGDLNYPSISVLFNQSMTASGPTVFSTVSRTLTNVGPANSSYTATCDAPSGLGVQVSPLVLNFTAVGEKQSFTITFSTIGVGGEDSFVTASFGFLVWSDGDHVVRSPLVGIWLGANRRFDQIPNNTTPSSLLHN